MGGQVLFQDALTARLDIIKPSSKDITRCLEAHPPKLTENVKVLIDTLHRRGVHVYLVSGGFRQVSYETFYFTISRTASTILATSFIE